MPSVSKTSQIERNVQALYQRLLEAWNRRDAQGMAALFAPHGSMVGFDGTSIDGGPLQIEAHLAPIFRDHPTAAYVSRIRWIRLLTEDVALLQAVAGMLPPAEDEINPAVNTVHVMVAVCRNGEWCVGHFQNTPAQFHGRPEAVSELTRELQEIAHKGRRKR